MKILFLGGTGIISTACTELAVARGLHVTLLNRGRRAPMPEDLATGLDAIIEALEGYA